MSRNATIAVVVGAIVVAVIGGWVALRMLGGVSEADYKTNFLASCQDAARQAFMKAGMPTADAQARAGTHCACAYSVVEPLSMREKLELEKREPARVEKLTADIKAKCVK